ncbi:MAG: YkgJ family cysteine cluster protein [Bacteroidota bacterium]
MECRIGCGACCIAPSISSPIPGMPNGKPSGVRCVQLAEDNRCMIFGLPERPEVCRSLRPSEEMCGASDGEAMENLIRLELATAPDRTGPTTLSPGPDC